MASKLSLYNGALSHLNTVRLARIDEPRFERYELDAVYDKAVAEALEKGNWKFAKRSARLDYDPDIEPEFGYQYAFAFPADYVRLMNICSDEYFRVEVEEYTQEQRYWYCDYQTIYVQWVSNDPDYGMDLGEWPPSFNAFAEATLALKSAIPIAKDRGTRNELFTIQNTLLATAKRFDAIGEPVKGKPAGRLVRSRAGGSSRPSFGNGKIRL